PGSEMPELPHALRLRGLRRAQARQPPARHVDDGEVEFPVVRAVLVRVSARGFSAVQLRENPRWNHAQPCERVRVHRGVTRKYASNFPRAVAQKTLLHATPLEIDEP